MTKRTARADRCRGLLSPSVDSRTGSFQAPRERIGDGSIHTVRSCRRGPAGGRIPSYVVGVGRTRGRPSEAESVRIAREPVIEERSARDPEAEGEGESLGRDGYISVDHRQDPGLSRVKDHRADTGGAGLGRLGRIVD